MELPDGRRLRGTGLSRPRDDVPDPDFAVYLLGRDPQVTGWSNRWVPWRDFSVPASVDDVVTALREAHSRAASERVEISCRGGVGRTGTAMALLASMSGVDPAEAVGWVRANYRPRAVETLRQQRWVEQVARTLLTGPE